MKLSKQVLSYIEGKEFSDRAAFLVAKQNHVINRIEFIKSLVANSNNVLHIGCLDHVPLIKGRRRRKSWLHDHLTEVANNCLGIDINQEGIEFAISQLDVTNIHYGDITSEHKISAITKNYWDFVVFGDVIEHINNPVVFLQSFLNNYQDNVDQIIISVPNSFRLESLKYMFYSTEIVNSDHRYWFTPYTICKVANQSGLQVKQLEMCKFSYSNNSLRDKFKDWLFQNYPIVADTIVIVCQKNKN